MKISIDSALSKAIEAHKAGDYVLADRYYTAILRIKPDHPDANHNLGVLALSLGKIRESIPFFKSAIRSNHTIDQFWKSYISALLEDNQLHQAKTELDKARTIGLKQNTICEIENQISKNELGPVSDQIKNKTEPSRDMLVSLFELYNSNLPEALKYVEKLMLSFPDSFALLNAAGVICTAMHKREEALNYFNAALRIKPNSAELYLNIGNFFKKANEIENAIFAYRKSIEINNNSADAWNNLGLSLFEKEAYEEAMEAFSKAIKLSPAMAIAYNNLGNTLSRQFKYEEAIKAYKSSISLDPNYAFSYNNLANIYKSQGDLSLAIAYYEKALSLNPKYAECHRHLSDLKKYERNMPEIAYLENLVLDDDCNELDRSHLHFALAKIYEDLESFESSFFHLSKGNKLRKKILNYTIDQDKRAFAQIKKTRRKIDNVDVPNEGGRSAIIPIFIVGMPRSGTTLIEQVISSHDEVKALGELSYVQKFGSEIAVGEKAANAEGILLFRNKYFAEIDLLTSGKRFFTDKLPQNFLFIPLILKAFPNAKIVHVVRDPSATCWSNFKHYFESNGLGYSFDLNDCVEYYSLYYEMMTDWKKTYSEMIYDLNYDDLVSNQREQTARLLRFLGLSWQEECMSPHKNRRSVSTASNEQIRRKIYQGSSQAWLNYKPFIDGKFDRLHTYTL